jgi:elongation factor P
VISTSDLKRGAMMELDGQIVQILSYEHQKIGRGSAQVRLKVKNIRSGAIFDTTAQAGTKWPRIRLDQRQVQYLYSEGDLHYFMDKDTYEQFPLSPAQLGEAVNFLKDGMELEVLMHDGQPVGVELPLNVVLKVLQTEPGFKGDTATGGSKPATLETGLTIQVPLFVNQGDRIRVDTRDGSYIERVVS